MSNITGTCTLYVSFVLIFTTMNIQNCQSYTLLSLSLFFAISLYIFIILILYDVYLHLHHSFEEYMNATFSFFC